MFLSVPHQTTRSYKTIKESIGKDIFVNGHKLEPYYVAAFALYRIEVNFRTQRISSKLKTAKFHMLLALRMLAAVAKIPKMNAGDMETYCKPMMELLWDANSSDDLIAKTATIIEDVAQGNFDSDNVRTLAFTERVIARSRAHLSER